MPLVTYSVLRLGLLAACFALGYLAGLRTWLLLGVAVLVAWGLSYVLLAGPRDAAAAYLVDRVERARGTRAVPGRLDRDAADEDALVEHAEHAARAEHAERAERAERLGTVPAGDVDGGRPGPSSPAGHPGETASPRPNSTP